MLRSPSLQLISLSLLKFLLLLFIIFILFWLIGAITEMPKGIQINRPVSSLTAFNPFIAALIITYAHSKSGGMKILLERCFADKGIKRWYLSIVLLMPTMMFFTYLIMLLMGNPLPEPIIPLLSVMSLFPLFFISAFDEEGGLVGVCNRSNAKTMGCTRSELNHWLSVGNMASPVVHSD